MTYRLLSISESDLSAAAHWYEAQAPGLGSAFIDEFVAVMNRVTSSPEAWRRVGRRHRRCLFRKFPYAVLYSVGEQEILVASIVPLRRDPERTEERVGKT